MSERLKNLFRGEERDGAAALSSPAGDIHARSPSPHRGGLLGKALTVVVGVATLAMVGLIDRPLVPRASSQSPTSGAPDNAAFAQAGTLLATVSEPQGSSANAPQREVVTATAASQPVAASTSAPNTRRNKAIPPACDKVAPREVANPTVARKTSRTNHHADQPSVTFQATSLPATPQTATLPEAGRAMTADGRIILNKATARELKLLPGIGAKRAAKIIALRQRLGRFRKLTDLLRVRGIGLKSLKKMLPRLVLDPLPAEESG